MGTDRPVSPSTHVDRRRVVAEPSADPVLVVDLVHQGDVDHLTTDASFT